MRSVPCFEWRSSDSEKKALPGSESVPRLREAARRLANLIIDQLNYAEGDLSADEIRELEALIEEKAAEPLGRGLFA